ncbi:MULTISPECIES: reverse transcriptase domain-containing protein [Rhodococcus]|uniref:reverse transcriptase domain-containing protein n=1 Tax=Rhodococcus TaxID=1827 RepID=UPI00193B4B93|nr:MULTISPECIES: reverse transcriptase domain-containing protein [Rhodococcus]QRI76702.1 hypothetical protein JQ505_02610 [Rhodococcus aetherivorans]QSE60121.1 hypothetical protein JYA75_03725 [Rhodococcus sp. PSBB066]QSE68574.1 hypothetical protein JYA91_23870 [Rhodococcus sp. PSBB049]
MEVSSQPPDFSVDALRSVYKEKVQGSSARGRDGVSARNLTDSQVERLIQATSAALMDGTYRPSPYREFLKLKGSGKAPRVISIPTVRDRLALAALSTHLRNSIPEICFQTPQKIVSSIKKSISGSEYRDFIRSDIVSFYPSISHLAVRSKLTQYGISSPIVDMIMRAIENPTVPDGAPKGAATFVDAGVPAGTPLANVLGEVVLHDFDHSMRSIPGVAFFRYVDDIVVLSRYGKRGTVKESIDLNLRLVGLKSHPKTSRDKHSAGRIDLGSFEYLGYTFEGGKVTVGKIRHANLINNLARPLTMLRRSHAEGAHDLDRIQKRAEWWLNFRITGCVGDGKRRGWLPYYSQIDDIGLLHHLDKVVENLISRLPSDRVVRPKSFLKAYAYTHDPQRDPGQYIVNFDQIKTTREKRKILQTASTYYNIPTGSESVEKLYRRFVSFACTELESDVGRIS